MTPREESHGFLPIVGTRVFVLSGRHFGFWGTVVERPAGWAERRVAVRLDEWPDEVFPFYNHNLIDKAQQSE